MIIAKRQIETIKVNGRLNDGKKGNDKKGSDRKS